MTNELKFGLDAKQAIKKGIDCLADAVKTTLGPQGQCVVIGDYFQNKPHVTKDGVTVAKNIQFKDKYMDAGASLIREAALKTVNSVGDATTTSTVLAQAFINNAMNALEKGCNAMELISGIDIIASDIKDIIITLEKVSGITLPENSELVIDKRYSGSSNEIINSKKPGVFSVIIPIEDADGISEFKLKMENLPIPITKTWESSLSLDNQTIYLLDENKIDARNVEGILASAGIRTIIGELPDDMVTDNGTSAEIKFIPAEDRKYIALTIRVNETGTAITENDIGNIIITLEKNDNDNAFDKDSAELNVRLNSSGETTALTGYVVSNYIPVSLSENTVTKLTIQGATLDDSNTSIVYCHSNYAPIYATMAGNYGASIKRNGTAVYKDENNNDYIKVGYVNTTVGNDSTSAYDTA
jgi:hypothetical protein